MSRALLSDKPPKKLAHRVQNLTKWDMPPFSDKRFSAACMLLLGALQAEVISGRPYWWHKQGSQAAYEVAYIQKIHSYTFKYIKLKITNSSREEHQLRAAPNLAKIKRKTRYLMLKFCCKEIWSNPKFFKVIDLVKSTFIWGTKSDLCLNWNREFGCFEGADTIKTTF